jgi:DNA-binding transcriptional MerR regulator
MSPVSQSPVYNVKAVLQETGLKPDVLRAWERRYNLPKPRRTPGGHRLYSEFDIAILKWLQARQAEGFTISRAVERCKEILDAGLDLFADASPVGAPSTNRSASAQPASIDLLRREWLAANLAFDSVRVDEALNQAFALYPLETVCTQILQRGMSEIGNAWHLNQATVQQEHFASALANRRLETLISAAPRPSRREIILLGCPPAERHTLSLLLLNLFLARYGYKVVYLGADVPVERLEETSRAVRADLVVLAAQQLASAATLRSTAFSLQAKSVPLAYGGLIFNRVPGLRERIPAYFLGESLEEAVRRIEQLLLAPATFSVVTPQDGDRGELARLYRQMRPEIETALSIELLEMGYPLDHLGAADIFLGDALSAALELGDPAFLEADLDWVARLLSGRQMPGNPLLPYLAAYRRSIQREMGLTGAAISDWIDSYITRKEATWPPRSS